MPTYTFENTKTGKVFDDFMSMDDKETYFCLLYTSPSPRD